MTIQQGPKGRKAATYADSREESISSEGMASAKALGWECARMAKAEMLKSSGRQDLKGVTVL